MSSMHLPWQTLGEPVELQVTAIKLDGEAFAFEPEKVIPLHESETDWQLAEITCAITMTAAALHQAGYSPETTSATVSLSSTRTKTRSAWIAEGSGDIRTAVLALHRNDLSLRLELCAVATTTIEGVEHREIGRSRATHIDVDPPEAPETGGPDPFDVIWVDFATAEIGPSILRDIAGEAFWIDLGGIMPTVYLNEGIKHMQAILDAKRPKGRMRDLQKILGSWIGSAAWSALAERAISEVSVGDDDEPSQELDPLSERVLRALATRMEGVGDFEELLGEIAESSHNTEKRRDLDSKVQIAIHRICDLSTGFAEAIENTWRA